MPHFSRRLDDGRELWLLEDRHAADVYALVDRNRAHLREWLPWVRDGYALDDARQWVRRSLEQFARGDGFQAGLAAGGTLVGVIGFHDLSRESRQTSVGYWLSADARGRGHMTAACRAMVDLAFAEWGLNRVEIRCATGNAKSRAVPERLGFTREGVIRDGEWLHDRFVDMEVYSVLAREWQPA